MDKADTYYMHKTLMEIRERAEHALSINPADESAYKNKRDCTMLLNLLAKYTVCVA